MQLSTLEGEILQTICIASHNNPNKPEFPPQNPAFPATPTVQIEVPGFSNVYLKDESKNPTGTHKDRLAWEMVVTYRDFLQAKVDGIHNNPLPQLSVITSGSAGLAIQTMLNAYKLPPLKCLVDEDLDSTIVDTLTHIGCHVYRHDLSKKALDCYEILQLTENEKGIDVTSGQGLDPSLRFYDWLSYEILNTSPDFCFCPYGTGHLYENILNINKREITSQEHDPRYTGDDTKLKTCNFMGATVDAKTSACDKLYAPHRPFATYDEQWLRVYVNAGHCGAQSKVHTVEEHYVNKALEIAADNGIDCEPSGIAGLGLLLQMESSVDPDAKILIVSTGKTKL